MYIVLHIVHKKAYKSFPHSMLFAVRYESFAHAVFIFRLDIFWPENGDKKKRNDIRW